MTELMKRSTRIHMIRRSDPAARRRGRIPGPDPLAPDGVTVISLYSPRFEFHPFFDLDIEIITKTLTRRYRLHHARHKQAYWKYTRLLDQTHPRRPPRPHARKMISRRHRGDSESVSSFDSDMSTGSSSRRRS